MPRTTPLKVVKLSRRGKTRWQVTGPKELAPVGKPRYRGPIRQTRAEAESDLYEQQKILFAQKAGHQSLTLVQELDAKRAMEIAARHGKSLEQMCVIADQWLLKQERTKSATLLEVWEGMILALKVSNSSASHIQAAQYHYSTTEKYDLPGKDGCIRELQAPDLRDWLNRLPLTPTTKANWLRYARMVGARAVRDKLAEENPFMAVDVPKAAASPVTYLLPAAAQRLLHHVNPHDLPIVAIGLFAGLRPHSELMTRTYAPVLSWSDIDWERLEIHVAAHRTKTARHRVVPMEPALVAWLQSLGPLPASGPIVVPGIRKRLEAAKVRAKVTWAPDILRHTYATMWLALNQDKARLAEQMGNSPAIIDQHYRFPLSRTVAEEFWALRP